MAELSLSALKSEQDSLAKLVQDYFAQSKEYRLEDQTKWQEANDTYHAQHRSYLEAVDTPSQGVFVHLVRRRVNTARVRLSSLLFESGKIPFNITPNKRPKVLAPDMMEMTPDQVIEESKLRAERMENHIRDILRKSDYVDIETVPSVGKKTSRFFKLHSDPEARCVPLDTHILKFVRDKHCHDTDFIPKSTPTSATKFYEIENLALTYMGNYISQSRTCDTIAKADLEIWSSYAS